MLEGYQAKVELIYSKYRYKKYITITPLFFIF